MFSALALKKSACLLPALGAFLAGLGLAWNHPLWPLVACMAFWLWCLMAAWRPSAWLLVVPACLPWLNFSPWTGWLVFEEFDLLLLGALAGGYGRLAFSLQSDAEAESSDVLWFPVALLLLLGASGLLALLIGLTDAGGFAFDWFAGYTDALNSVRAFKSLAFALLFVPLLAPHAGPAKTRNGQLLAWGMVLGLTEVTLAVVWERAAFPGLLDFSSHYRTVALFWEMHVGGAAIDVYLALATPFVVWSLIRARHPVAWAGAAALALLTGYACLTSFSRGVYAAVLGSLGLLGLLLWTQKYDFNALKLGTSVWQRYRPADWRPKASLMLVLALLAEVITVLGAGSFMMDRLDNADRDLGSRLAHWQHGVALLDGPGDWLLGKGLGRFPVQYASHAPHAEFPGAIRLAQELQPNGSVNDFVTVSGPSTQKRLAGSYALTQRVAVVPVGQQWVSLSVRAKVATDVYVDLCERHLLYDGNCQGALIRVLPGKVAWQTRVLPLRGAALTGGQWFAPRLRMLSLSVANAGGGVDIDNVRLTGPNGQAVLANGNFSQGLAHWFPAAQSYFVPWHMDNLFLEVLLERGGLGLLLLMVLVNVALWHAVCGRTRLEVLSPFLAASLCAVLLVGLVSSVMDVPRVSFLFYLLALACIPLRVRRA